MYTNSRVELMFGNKPTMYVISWLLLGLGYGFLIARCRFNILYLIGWLLTVHLFDALLKTIVFIKENFFFKISIGMK